jgi:hypothetical protein
MVSIQHLIAALDERTIAQQVGLAHDQARLRFPLERNVVDDFDEFANVIGEYYAYHFTTCVSNGGSLSPANSRSQAKQIVEQEYRRRNGDIASAFNDAHDGTNGGLRTQLDVLADALKAESVARYTRDVFDRHVAPNRWEDKVEIIRQFIARFGALLGNAIRADQPERYAQNYEELIRAYVRALQQTSSVFRRL